MKVASVDKNVSFLSYLNLISDLIRWIVSAQNVDSISHGHCSSIEPSTFKWPFTLPHTGLWTKTVDLKGKKRHTFTQVQSISQQKLSFLILILSNCNGMTDKLRHGSLYMWTSHRGAVYYWLTQLWPMSHGRTGQTLPPGGSTGHAGRHSRRSSRVRG